MSTEFKQGNNLIPEVRDPGVYHKADSISMPPSPITVKPLPQPDSIQLNGAEPSDAGASASE